MTQALTSTIAEQAPEELKPMLAGASQMFASMSSSMFGVQLGEALGGRDHTTVIYACEKVADMIERDDRLRRQVLKIREQLYGQRSN